MPCGLMAVLLTLDYRHVKNISLTGVDFDYDSLVMAHDIARKNQLEGAVVFIQADVWQVDFEEKFDIIVSHGLNYYQPQTEESIIALYRKINKALKPGGMLVTSFRTPTPRQGNCPWNMDYIDPEYLRLQYVLFHEVLSGKWGKTCTVEEMAAILEKSGFVEMEVIYDRAKIFPTVIAKKA